jgi:5-methylcytosine-specific restriction endonuclease McrA
MTEKRKHETKSDGRAERKKLYDTKRWRAMRRLVMYEHPFCQWVEDEATGRLCNRKGDEVDHIIPRSQRRDLEWERSNLQTLCHMHHSTKTAIENKLGATLRHEG